MSREPERANQAGEVARRLASLAREPVEIPPADTVYWRARARLAIDETAHRRRLDVRPLREFQRAIGGGAVVLGALMSALPLLATLPPGAGFFTVPLLAVAVATGAYLLAEAAESGSSATPNATL